jgi:hypothetical protein
MELAARVVAFLLLGFRAVGNVALAFFLGKGIPALILLGFGAAYAASIFGIAKRERWGYYFALGLVAFDLLLTLLVILYMGTVVPPAVGALLVDFLLGSSVWYLLKRDLKGGENPLR